MTCPRCHASEKKFFEQSTIEGAFNTITRDREATKEAALEEKLPATLEPQDEVIKDESPSTSEPPMAESTDKSKEEDEPDESSLPDTIKALELLAQEGITAAEKKLAKLRERNHEQNDRHEVTKPAAAAPSPGPGTPGPGKERDLQVRAAMGDYEAIAKLNRKRKPEHDHLRQSEESSKKPKPYIGLGGTLVNNIFEGYETGEKAREDKKHRTELRHLAKDAAGRQQLKQMRESGNVIAGEVLQSKLSQMEKIRDRVRARRAAAKEKIAESSKPQPGTTEAASAEMESGGVEDEEDEEEEHGHGDEGKEFEHSQEEQQFGLDEPWGAPEHMTKPSVNPTDEEVTERSETDKEEKEADLPMTTAASRSNAPEGKPKPNTDPTDREMIDLSETDKEEKEAGLPMATAASRSNAPEGKPKPSVDPTDKEIIDLSETNPNKTEDDLPTAAPSCSTGNGPNAEIADIHLGIETDSSESATDNRSTAASPSTKSVDTAATIPSFDIKANTSNSDLSNEKIIQLKLQQNRLKQEEISLQMQLLRCQKEDRE
ncbi:Hypothetical predicted protein [Lecanosticta acicola]|uniref:Uncharacterized protein n=1 Tax=Lecanosticta acicola TaxID=111012 RepID=A0AAI9EBL4_9PEZI|nr:Hypothetical predicted protein [Lecanosticta acicola]